MIKYALFLTLALLVPLAHARTWTSTAGTTVEAELLGVRGDTVVLQNAAGRRISIPLDKFSDDDQTYIRNLLAEKQPQPASAPEASPPAGDPAPGAPPPAAAPAAPAKKPVTAIPGVTYEAAPGLTSEKLPPFPGLPEGASTQYWAFQYGPTANDIAYFVFAQEDLDVPYTALGVYSPNHPRYKTPQLVEFKKSKWEEDKVHKYSGISLPGKHGPLTVTYDLEFIAGIVRADLCTVFVSASLNQRGVVNTFDYAGELVERFSISGDPIRVTPGLAPVKLEVKPEQKFGKPSVKGSLTLDGMHLLPGKGMKSTVKVEAREEGGKVREKVELEFDEAWLTGDAHRSPTAKFIKLKPGTTYDIVGTLDLGPILGPQESSKKLKLAAKDDDD